MHLCLPGDEAVLSAALALPDDQCIKVRLQPGKLQLALCDLVQSHTQQAVLMQLAKVVDACRAVERGRRGRGENKGPGLRCMASAFMFSDTIGLLFKGGG